MSISMITRRRWVWVATTVSSALLITGCAWGVSLSGGLLALLLVLTLVGASCTNRSIGTEEDGGARPDSSATTDSGVSSDCGEGWCPDHLTCVELPQRGPWCLPDADEDGIWDGEDNCPWAFNPAQEDDDEDGVGDACDACDFPNELSPCGDACCLDADGDGIPSAGEAWPNPSTDNCPWIANPSQLDSDNDGVGDACDLWPYDPNPLTPCGWPGLDSDADGLQDWGHCDGSETDSCPYTPSDTFNDQDGDGVDDVCDPDGIPPMTAALEFREARRRALLQRFQRQGVLDAHTVRLALA